MAAEEHADHAGEAVDGPHRLEERGHPATGEMADAADAADEHDDVPAPPLSEAPLQF